MQALQRQAANSTPTTDLLAKFQSLVEAHGDYRLRNDEDWLQVSSRLQQDYQESMIREREVLKCGLREFVQSKPSILKLCQVSSEMQSLLTLTTTVSNTPSIDLDKEDSSPSIVDLIDEKRVFAHLEFDYENAARDASDFGQAKSALTLYHCKAMELTN